MNELGVYNGLYSKCWAQSSKEKLSSQETLARAKNYINKEQLLSQENKDNLNSNLPAFGKSDDSSVTSSMVKMFQNLGILIGILLIGSWVHTKWLIKTPKLEQKKIKILERLMVDTKTRLTLIEIENSKILVGNNGTSITLLNIHSSKAPSSSLDKDFDIDLSEEISA